MTSNNYHQLQDLTVCNDFGNNVPYSAYLEAFSQTRAPRCLR